MEDKLSVLLVQHSKKKQKKIIKLSLTVNGGDSVQAFCKLSNHPIRQNVIFNELIYWNK